MNVKIVRRRMDDNAPVEFNKYDKLLPRYTTSNVQPEPEEDWDTGTHPVYRSSGESDTSVGQALGESVNVTDDKAQKIVEKSLSKAIKVLKKLGYPAKKLISASKNASKQISRLLDSNKPSPKAIQRILENNFDNLLPDAKSIGGEDAEERNKHRMKIIYVRIVVYAVFIQALVLLVGMTKFSKSDAYKIVVKVMLAVLPTMTHQIIIKFGRKGTSRLITVIETLIKTIYGFFISSTITSSGRAFAGAGLFGAFQLITREIQIFLIENGYDEAAFAFTSFLTGLGNYIDTKIAPF